MFILKIQPLINEHYDHLVMNSRRFTNENIIYGKLSDNVTHLVLATDVIETACLYNDAQTCYIARFPNLYESS